MHPNLQAPWRVPARLALCLVLGMLGIFVVAGVGQDGLQVVQPAERYLARLLSGGPWLRTTLALDNLFILAYGTVFVLVGQHLWRAGRNRALVLTSAGLLLLTALLDSAENMHFMVMLAQAELGMTPSASQISAQVAESMFKFHTSYLGLLLLGFALPRRTRGQRMLALLLRWVQAPVGVAIYAVPAMLVPPLIFARLGLFVLGLGLFSVVSLSDDDAAGSGAPA